MTSPAPITAPVGNPVEKPVSDVVFFDWRTYIEACGDFVDFALRAMKAARRLPHELAEFLRQCDALGARSAALVCVAGAATGVVMSMQTRASLTRFGAEAMLPTIIIFSLIKETGPVVTGLVVSGQVGARIGAELAAMKVSEQIDAMEASAVNPYEYLVATRIAACTLALPLLTLMADACGVLAGWLAMTLSQPISIGVFFHEGLKGATFNDFLPSTAKALVFGWIIGTVSCYQGIKAGKGTEAVGTSSTRSVVLSSLLIILADVLLVRIILVLFP